MQVISKYNKEVRFLSCVIDVVCKYAWNIPFKNKKSEMISKAFQKVVKESNWEPKGMG